MREHVFYDGGSHRFLINNHTLKEVIATSYDVALRLISGGPVWIDPIDAIWNGHLMERRPQRTMPTLSRTFSSQYSSSVLDWNRRRTVEILVIDHVKGDEIREARVTT